MSPSRPHGQGQIVGTNDLVRIGVTLGGVAEDNAQGSQMYVFLAGVFDRHALAAAVEIRHVQGNVAAGVGRPRNRIARR